ncbi:MAG TPA: PleD family two-component system response regulator [Acetobacteraceae bacterium]|nr:PleD family two-component system response regulator [Acetobacteraceae bacterium]
MTAKILVVDDLPSVREFLDAKLSSAYFQVLTADCAAAALHAAREWQPDLVLLDVMMPGMDGYECCRRLKADPVTEHIPVVMLTALAGAADRLRALEAGADDFLSRPVRLRTLMTRARGLVRLKRLLDEWRARAMTVHSLGLTDGTQEPLTVAAARVLLIEDSDADAAMVEHALAAEAMRSRRVADESEAARALQGESWDLVMLSLRLRCCDPLRLAARLRAAEGTQHVPLLLLADKDGRARSLRAFEMGADDWAQRPLDVNELRLRARNQVRRKRYQDQLRATLGEALSLAVLDPLTGLYNRRYVLHHLTRLLAAEPVPQLSVLIADLDRFKAVNDASGHAAGDAALQAVAETLRANTRAFDTLARMGGEEFLAIMPGTDCVEAARIAERLRAAVAETAVATNGASPGRLTISIGVACTADCGRDERALLAAADTALYEAKRAGRDRVAVARCAPTAA